jgi:hypothetical protein
MRVGGLPSVPRDLYPEPTSYVGQWVESPRPFLQFSRWDAPALREQGNPLETAQQTCH